MFKSLIPQKKPKIAILDPISDINKKFGLFIYFVIGILLISVVIMLLMVGNLIVDSFHFNSTIYKEYSEKIDTRKDLIETNKKLMGTEKTLLKINESNQKIIEDLTKKLNEK